MPFLSGLAVAIGIGNRFFLFLVPFANCQLETAN